MADLSAGSLIQASDWPVSARAADGTDILNIASTSYIPGTPVVSIQFRGSTTGRALLTVSLSARDDNGIQSVMLAPEIYQGADATAPLFLPADVGNRGVRSADQSTNYCWWSRTTLLEGLTQDQLYFARTVHRVIAASGDISYRDIMIEAAP